MNVRLVDDIFLVKKARNMCTHDRCISCGEFKDDVHWIEGKGILL